MVSTEKIVGSFRYRSSIRSSDYSFIFIYKQFLRIARSLPCGFVLPICDKYFPSACGLCFCEHSGVLRSLCYRCFASPQRELQFLADSSPIVLANSTRLESVLPAEAGIALQAVQQLNESLTACPSVRFATVNKPLAGLGF